MTDKDKTVGGMTRDTFDCIGPSAKRPRDKSRVLVSSPMGAVSLTCDEWDAFLAAAFDSRGIRDGLERAAKMIGGCEGQHHGTGTSDCPKNLHHHHDERCRWAATIRAEASKLDGEEPKLPHHEYCDTMELSPSLGPSEKPCNCRGRQPEPPAEERTGCGACGPNGPCEWHS